MITEIWDITWRTKARHREASCYHGRGVEESHITMIIIIVTPGIKNTISR